MTLKWDRLSSPVVLLYYRATIANGALPLYAYIASNGAGWWNACISPDADDAMMEHPRRLEVAGAKTLAGAKKNVDDALTEYAATLTGRRPHRKT